MFSAKENGWMVIPAAGQIFSHWNFAVHPMVSKLMEVLYVQMTHM